MGRFDGKTTVLTGAAQGIGFACAERFGYEGAAVVLVDINRELGERAAAGMREQGSHATFVPCDVGVKEQVAAMCEWVYERHACVDVLVNNAGTSNPKEFLEVNEAEFDDVVRSNLKSVFLCGQAFARRMVQLRTKGAIINMSSINAVVAAPTGAAYAASKGAINQLTKVMAISLARYGIRVNAIGPGTIVTELTRRNLLSSEQARRRVLARTPLGRCGEPNEVASVAAFLASDDASYLTGQIIYPDGGRLALNGTMPEFE